MNLGTFLNHGTPIAYCVELLGAYRSLNVNADEAISSTGEIADDIVAAVTIGVFVSMQVVVKKIRRHTMSGRRVIEK